MQRTMLFHLKISLWALLNPFLDLGQVLHCLLESTDLRELVHSSTKPCIGEHSTNYHCHSKVSICHLQWSGGAADQ